MSPGTGDLYLQPHEGLVFIDTTKDGSFLTHIVTLRKQKLPEGRDWALCFTDDGFGALVSDDEVLCLEDWLTRQYYISETGAKFICETGSGSTANASPWNLTRKMMMMYEISNVHLGFEGSTVALPTYSMEWP